MPAANPAPAKPPAPIWHHDHTGLAVWVNGGEIETSLLYEFSRNSPAELVGIGEQLTAAIGEATKWANRWNPVTGNYDKKESTDA